MSVEHLFINIKHDTQHPQANKYKWQRECRARPRSLLARPLSNIGRNEIAIHQFRYDFQVFCSRIFSHHDFFTSLKIYHLINFMTSYFSLLASRGSCLVHIIIIFACFENVLPQTHLYSFKSTHQNISNWMFCVVCHFFVSYLPLSVSFDRLSGIFNVLVFTANIIGKAAHNNGRSSNNFHKSHDLMFKRDRVKLINTSCACVRVCIFCSIHAVDVISFHSMCWSSFLGLLLFIYDSLFIHSVTVFACWHTATKRLINSSRA